MTTETLTLTDRQTAILRLVGEDKTSREIGQDLRLTEATVKTHLHRAFRRLGVVTRSQAVVTAYGAGLIT